MAFILYSFLYSFFFFSFFLFSPGGGDFPNIITDLEMISKKLFNRGSIKLTLDTTGPFFSGNNAVLLETSRVYVPFIMAVFFLILSGYALLAKLHVLQYFIYLCGWSYCVCRFKNIFFWFTIDIIQWKVSCV